MSNADDCERFTAEVFVEDGPVLQLNETEFIDLLLAYHNVDRDGDDDDDDGDDDDDSDDNANYTELACNIFFTEMRDPAKVLDAMATETARQKLCGIAADFTTGKHAELSLRFSSYLPMWNELDQLTIADADPSVEFFTNIGKLLSQGHLLSLHLNNCGMTDELGAILLEPIRNAKKLDSFGFHNTTSNLSQEFVTQLVRALDGRPLRHVDISQEHALDLSALKQLIAYDDYGRLLDAPHRP